MPSRKVIASVLIALLVIGTDPLDCRDDQGILALSAEPNWVILSVVWIGTMGICTYMALEEDKGFLLLCLMTLIGDGALVKAIEELGPH